MTTYDGYRAQVMIALEPRGQRGRALIDGMWHKAGVLLRGAHVVDVEIDFARDVYVVTFEGERLPGWRRGTYPSMFASLDDLKLYRRLRAIYDIRWPNEIHRSSDAVYAVIRHSGNVSVTRSAVGEGEPYVVSPLVESYMHLVLGPRAVSDDVVDWSSTREG